MLVKHQVAVPEMGAREMPVKVFRLEVEREYVRQQGGQRSSDVGACVLAKVSGSIQGNFVQSVVHRFFHSVLRDTPRDIATYLGSVESAGRRVLILAQSRRSIRTSQSIPRQYAVYALADTVSRPPLRYLDGARQKTDKHVFEIKGGCRCEGGLDKGVDG
jgi:hypothetical protein